MSKVRYFIMPRERRWTLRSGRRRIGAFADREQAAMIAVEVATVGLLHGRRVEVLEMDDDGRWCDALITNQIIAI